MEGTDSDAAAARIFGERAIMGRAHKDGSTIAHATLFKAIAAALIGALMLSGCGGSSGGTAAGTSSPAGPQPSIAASQNTPTAAVPTDCSTLSDESQDAVDNDSGTASHTVSPREQCEAAQYWSSGRLAPWTPQTAGTGEAGDTAADGRLPRVEDAYAADRRDEALSSAPNLDNERAQPIISYAVVAADRLRIYFTGGVCDAYRVAIEETGDHVRLNLFAGAEPRTGSTGAQAGSCTEQAAYQSALVALQTPLADRPVISK